MRVALWLVAYSQDLDGPKSSRTKGPLVKGRVSGNRNTWSHFRGNDQNDTKVKSLLHHVAKLDDRRRQKFSGRDLSENSLVTLYASGISGNGESSL